MRLNTYISHNSIYSRRKADELISQGRVKIDHKKANLGDMVLPNQKVFIDGKLLKVNKDEQYTMIVYHKPKGELVSSKDDRNRRIIYESLGSKFKGFVPVGRLDFASEGLLILSDSKKIVSALMRSNLEREYILKIDCQVTQEMISAMQEGLKILESKAGAHKLSKPMDMEFKPFAEFKILKNSKTYSRLKVSITEGKNRELRRFFAHFKANVLDLRRIRYGFVCLNALPVGKVRYFTKDEYKKLRHFLGSQNLK